MTRQERSRMMSRIRAKNTKPERIVRSLLHRMGYRFRIHCAALPGKPDIVLAKHRTVIFVHGCFWHRHEGCKYAYTPKSRLRFWSRKFSRNVERHIEVQQELEGLGWRVFLVWECETVDLESLMLRLQQQLAKSNSRKRPSRSFSSNTPR